MPKASAMSAIFLHSDNPPAAQVSGWMMSIARDTKRSRKPNRVNSHSPPAIGIEIAAFTALYPVTSSGGTGSSNHPMSCCSIILPRRIAATAS